MNDTSDVRSDKSDRRTVLFEEAIRQFNESGYADTRLEDIGASLGTAKTSISYYFQSKEGLVQEVYDQALAFSETALVQASREPNGRSALLAFVRQHTKAHADALAKKRAPLALIGDLPISPGAVTDFAEPRYANLVKGIYELFLRGNSDGSVTVLSHKAACFFILNLLHWLPRWLSEVRRPDQEAGIDALLDVLTRGIAEPGMKPWARPINREPQNESESIFDRKKRNEMKREALLRVGTRALNAHGYRGISLNDVASELGVTRGALYYHFADKDALIRGCFDRTCTLIETALSLAEKPDIRSLEVLTRALKWLLERQISNLDPLVRVSLLGALEPRDRLIINARLSRIGAGFSNILASGMRDGSVRTVEIKAIEHMIIGTLFAANERRLLLLKPLADSAGDEGRITAQTYYHILLYGLSGGNRND